MWARPLEDGSHALCFVNFAKEEATAACDAACLRGLGIATGARVRDVVGRRDLPDLDANEGLGVTLAADGGSALYRLAKPQPAAARRDD